jgi:nitrogen PTS system EIIA component
MPKPAGFLQGLVDARLVFQDLKATNLEELLAEMSERVAAAGLVRDPGDLARRLIEREKLGCTGLGDGVAIPHCKLKEVEDVVLAIGVSPRGVDFHASDGIPVSLIFLALSPADAPALHLQALARISRALRIPGIADSLRHAASAEEIAETLREAEAEVKA